MVSSNAGWTLDELYEGLVNELTWIYAKWREFEKLFAVPQAEIDLLNRTAPDFFVLVRDSLVDDIILGICRLTDPARSMGFDNLSIGQLPTHPDVISDPDLAKELVRLIAIADPLTEFARQRRNKQLAHRDLPTALRLADNPLIGYKRSDVERVLKAIGSVLKAAENYRSGHDIFFGELAGFGDSDRLLGYLRAGLEVERDKRKRLGIPERDR